MKKFEYDYGNVIKQILSYSVIFIGNFSLFLFVLLLSIGIYIEIYYIFDEFFVAKYILIFLFFFETILFIYKFVLETFRKKEVIINDVCIKIKKGFIDINPFGFNYLILYNNISYCGLYNKKKPFFHDKKNYATVFFNYSSLVKLIDKQGHEYYLPLKNPGDFIEEVNKHIMN